MEIKKTKKIEEAINMAKQLHEGHKRASGEYFYEHTIRVYEKLKQIGIKDESTLIAAILHQALEFDPTIEEIIEKKFGSDVFTLIKNYKKLSEIKVERETPKMYNEKYVMQTYINTADDIRTLVIRLADKIDNMETSLVLPKEKRIDNSYKALYFYAPLARLIGMGKLAIQLENSAFKILYPGEYRHLDNVINKRLNKVYKTIYEMEKIVRELLTEHGIKSKIFYRAKHLYGIFQKTNHLLKDGKEPGRNYENIYDLVGMRIVVENEEECYMVENILNELMEYLPEQRDDYIRKPRHTGYKSIHNVYKVTKDLRVEVQVRTEEMNKLAEFGPASHLLYKIGDKNNDSLAAKQFKGYLKTDPLWFKDLNFWEAEKALEEYKPTTPFSKFVYAFTPKGDIIELRKGSNVIDFAYAVHTTLGHSCVGGMVNGQLVKLSYEIKDGDHVEVKTLKSKRKPSSDWLKTVKTNRAKTGIRKALKIR